MINISYAIVLTLIGLVIGLVAFLKKMSKNARMTTGIIALFGIALALSAFVFPASQLGIALGTPIGQASTTTTTLSAVPTTPTTTTTSTLCTVDKTTVTLAGQDKYVSTPVGGNHRYRIDTAIAKTVADAGTFTGAPFNALNILWMNESKTGYFAKPQIVSVPCSGIDPVSVNLVKNGSLTTNVKDNNDVLTSNSYAQSLNAGDVYDLKMTIRGDYQKEFPYGVVAVVEYNKTAIDSMKLLYSDGSGELQPASVPISYTPSLSSSSSSRVAFFVPEIISNKEYNYLLRVDANDATAPDGPDGNATITYFPRTYYIDEKNGGIYAGPSVEDENNAVTRTGQIVYTFNYN